MRATTCVCAVALVLLNISVDQCFSAVAGTAVSVVPAGYQRCSNFTGTFIVGLGDVFTTSLGNYLAASGSRVLHNDLLVLPLMSNTSSTEPVSSFDLDCTVLEQYDFVVANFLSANVTELASQVPRARLMFVQPGAAQWWHLALDKYQGLQDHFHGQFLPPSYRAMLQFTISQNPPDQATWINAFEALARAIASPMLRNRSTVLHTIGDDALRATPANCNDAICLLGNTTSSLSAFLAEQRHGSVTANVSSASLGYYTDRFMAKGLGRANLACNAVPLQLREHFAWVVLIDGYGSLPPSNLSALVTAAGVTAASIRNTGSIGQLVALIQPDLPQVFRTQLRHHGFILRVVETLSLANSWKYRLNDGSVEFLPNLRSVYLKKMHAVALTEFKRIIFIDVRADMLRNG